MDELIFHVLHRQSPFGNGEHYQLRVDTAPKLEYACALDLESGEILHFTADNADDLTRLIRSAKTIISYRGKEFGLFVLRKHHGLSGKVPKGGKHIDLHDSMLKISRGKNVSLEKAVFSNIGDGSYIQRKAFKYMTPDDLRACCESDISNIHQLYNLFKTNSLALKNMPRKVAKTRKPEPVTEDLNPLELRPGTTNPNLWFPDRPPKSQWNRIRKVVLERDKSACQFCGHVAKKFMNIHHINESGENDPDNLVTCCVACHAVMHMGLNLTHRIIEIWKCEIPQVEIVRLTREGVRNGKSLAEINKSLPLSKGRYKPDSLQYANSLVARMGLNPRAQLKKPLCAVFVNLKRWQIE